MQNLLLLLAKYGSWILFVILEVFCFYLITNYNSKQEKIFIHSANLISGQFNNRINTLSDYFKLKDQNDSLRVENAKLLQQILNIPELALSEEKVKKDTFLNKFELIPANICSKTLHLRNNHFTICKGEKDGIKPGMGVLSKNGIVGIVKDVSENYAHILNLLNSQIRISAIIKDKEYHGNLVWKGKNHKILHLEAIPKHANIEVGDEIITSGYSTIFPKGFDVGKVMNFSIPSGSNNYEIEVEINNDLYTVHTLYVVSNRYADEQLQLEKENSDE